MHICTITLKAIRICNGDPTVRPGPGVGAQNLLPYIPIYVGSGLGQNLPCVYIRLAQNLPCVEFRPAPNLPPQARPYPCVDFGLS